MKPAYEILKLYHYSSEPYMPSYKSTKEVYSEIGYESDNLIKQNSAYRNTCAVRMSIALIKAGVAFRGRLKIKIKEGSLKERLVEPGAIRLADELKRIWGKPLVLLGARRTAKDIGDKKGVIFFHTISSTYPGGHIDLYEPPGVCNSNCFFEAREVWFWALP